jgi:coenzyme PQQ synthesis protein D (PqqD)
LALRHFTIDRPHIIDETIDGETVVIDLRSGFYFCLNESGTAIWHLLDSTPSATDIADELARNREADPKTIEAAVTQFLDELEVNQLVRAESDSARSERPTVADQSPRPPGAPRARFVEPKVEKYTDMHDLILLDPVHQMDGRGWPHARDDVATAGQ